MGKKKKITFITFAGSPGETDPKYTEISGARDRLVAQAVSSGRFSKCLGLDWPTLQLLCLKWDVEVPVSPHRYTFTPLIAKLISLGAFGDEDFFFYAGAGCEINLNYFAQHDLRRMTRRAHRNSIYLEHTLLPEKMFTKQEVFDQLHVNARDQISPQVMATFFLVANRFKNGEKFKLFSNWHELSVRNNGQLISDAYNSAIHDKSFLAHRNDQSLLSVLTKQLGIKTYMERQRNFVRFFPSLRGSIIFLWTPRNRSSLSVLPRRASSPWLGFLMSGLSLASEAIHRIRSIYRLKLNMQSVARKTSH